MQLFTIVDKIYRNSILVLIEFREYVCNYVIFN